MIRRPPRSTLSSSSAASDVYKRQFLSDEEKEKDKFVCVNFTNFVERNSEVNFNSRVDGYFLEDADNLEDVDVKLKIDDYSEIK